MNELGKNIYENFGPLLPLDASGWNGQHKFIREVITETKPKTVIEVGTWKGLSALHMCVVLKELNIKSKVYCVDTWLGSLDFWYNKTDENDNFMDLKLKFGYPQVYYQFISNVIYYECQDYIIPVPCTSVTGAKLLKSQNVKADLIYIDASHETEDVYNDMKHYMPLLEKGGTMFGDDYNKESVKIAVHQYSHDTNTVFWTTPDGFWVIKNS